jgi:hypothetical protein
VIYYVYTAEKQPATCYTDYIPNGAAKTFTNPPRRVKTCYGCRRRRRCENLTVQCFYDGPRFWCNGGCNRRALK